VGRAVALAQAGDPSAGLNALDALPQSSVVNYQPFWAARGHLMRLLNRRDEASRAFTRAASLTDDSALRDYLFKRIAENHLENAYQRNNRSWEADLHEKSSEFD
jgi:RNA polymerase sigma-70 factor (ECF subfamily)